MGGKKLDILCIGNAIVDVFAQGDEKLAAQYGISGAVQHIEIEKLHSLLSELSPSCPETQTGQQLNSADFAALPLTAVSGGGAANVAKIAGLLGMKTGFIGALGKEDKKNQGVQSDPMGQLFKRDMDAAGVKLLLSFKPSPTGICLMLRIGPSETRIVASPSAARELSLDDVSEKEIKNSSMVIIDGFMLDKMDMVRHILDLTKRYKTTAVLDLASPLIAGEKAAEIASLTQKYPMLVFMNEQEAFSFYSGLGLEIRAPTAATITAEGEFITVERRDPNSTFRQICSFFQFFTAGKDLPLIIIKLGERGALAFSSGEIYRSETQAVVPKETTGAGDAFSAAFLSAWIREKELPECAALGNMAARVVLGVEGTQVDREALKDVSDQLHRK